MFFDTFLNFFACDPVTVKVYSSYFTDMLFVTSVFVDTLLYLLVPEMGRAMVLGLERAIMLGVGKTMVPGLG